MTKPHDVQLEAQKWVSVHFFGYTPIEWKWVYQSGVSIQTLSNYVVFMLSGYQETQ